MRGAGFAGAAFLRGGFFADGFFCLRSVGPKRFRAGTGLRSLRGFAGGAFLRGFAGAAFFRRGVEVPRRFFFFVPTQHLFYAPPNQAVNAEARNLRP